MIFDPEKIEKFESAPCILSFLIHSNRIDKDFDDYISEAIEDLHPLTGENICVFYLDSKFKSKKWSRTETKTSYPVGFFVPGMKLKPIRSRVRVDEQVFLMEVSDYFLKGDYVRMPSIAFFESFHSNTFYVIDLYGWKNEDVSKFILECAGESKNIWTSLEFTGDTVTANDRKNAFLQFEAFLKRHKYWRKFKNIAQNSTVLAMASSAIGLV